MKFKVTGIKFIDPFHYCCSDIRLPLCVLSSQTDQKDVLSASAMPGTSREDQKAPVVEFGTDLVYWENPEQIEAPSVVKLVALYCMYLSAEEGATHRLNMFCTLSRYLSNIFLKSEREEKNNKREA